MDQSVRTPVNTPAPNKLRAFAEMRVDSVSRKLCDVHYDRSYQTFRQYIHVIASKL